ncbi:hypothetical protein QUF76_13920 [Desulfobacterales bacterium HSG16]|nr:hypothetical protein [Desulfobacterales bacterium HSG16]
MKKNGYPSCFGTLEIVFPIDENGLRSTPVKCMVCENKTPCLSHAMKQSSGLTVKEEMVDRAYDSNMMGFFERWSRKKDLQRRRQKKVNKF